MRMHTRRYISSTRTLLRGAVGAAFIGALVLGVGMFGDTPPSNAVSTTPQAGNESNPDNLLGTEIPAEQNEEEGSPIEPAPEADEPETSAPEVNDEQGSPPSPENTTLSLSSVIPGQIAAPASWAERPALRLGGADRYEAAASITRQAYPSTADTVIIATGEIFSDSLSAAPLSAKIKAPLLPVTENAIPAVIRAELARLKPTKIIIAGGPGSVGPAVESALKQYSPDTVRVFGSDRYTTSVEIARFGWPSGATDVFVATGDGFSDALSAGAAAAKLGGPVLLVPGSSSALPTQSSAEINRLGAARIHIAGGPASVSPAIESSLGGQGRSVVRYSGKDRYEVSANISNLTFQGSADVYWANGLAFADALAGAAAAGARGAALLLVESECVPSASYSATDRLLPGQILILGGAGTLKDKVQYGNECMPRPAGTNDSDWNGIQEMYSRLNKERFERGLGGLRVSDSLRGNPAQAWAARIVKGQALNNRDLSYAEPWVRYQVSSVTKASSNRVQRNYDLIHSYQGASRWLYQPNAGVRGFVSVGYATASGQSAAVLLLGAGADG